MTALWQHPQSSSWKVWINKLFASLIPSCQMWRTTLIHSVCCHIRGLDQLFRPPAATQAAVCARGTFHGCLLRTELTHHSRQKSAQAGPGLFVPRWYWIINQTCLLTKDGKTKVYHTVALLHSMKTQQGLKFAEFLFLYLPFFCLSCSCSPAPPALSPPRAAHQ